MQQKYLTLIASLALSFTSNVQTEISIINLKGMTSSVRKPDIGVKQQYAELSPAVGALFWHSPLLKNIYEYAPEHEAFTKFVKELFHVHVDGSFDTTRLPTKITFYFDPTIIGQLVSLIYQVENALSFDKAAFVKNISENLIAPMVKEKEDIIRQAFIDNYTKAIARFNYDIEKMNEKIKEEKEEKTKADLLKQSTRRKAAAETYAGMLKKIKNPEAPIKDSMFTKSLQEIAPLIADIVSQELSGRYPKGLIINCLLAALWKKASIIEDLRQYLDVIAKTLNIQTDQLYFWPLKPDEYTIADYEKLKHLDNPAAIENLSIDDLVFVRFAYNIYDNPLPPKVEMIGNAHYQEKEFSDCGETSLRNFINALIYNNNEKKFDLVILKTLSAGNPDPSLFEFYSRFATNTKIKENIAHDVWANIVSNLPRIKYASGTYDIDEGFNNMIHVITALFPQIHTLQDLADTLKKHHDIEITINSQFPLEGPQAKNINNDVTLTIKKTGANPFDIVWHFTPGHFELDFPEPDEIPYALTYIHAISQDKAHMSFLKACIYASFATDYKQLNGISVLHKEIINKFILPLNSDEQKQNTASLIASLENPSENEKLFVAKLSKNLSRDYEVLEDFFYTIYEINPALTEFVLQQQADLIGLAAAIDVVLTENLETLYDWAAKPEHLQIIGTSSPSYLLETLIQESFAQADENKKELLLKFYDWGTRPQIIANIKPDEISDIISSLLENPLPQNDEARQQQEFERKIYNWILTQDFNQNLELDPDLIVIMLNTPIPEENTVTKYLLLKLYDWALAQNFAQSLELDPNLIETILNTPTPEDRNEAKKKEFLLKLYNWALAQNLSQNLELNPDLIATILITQFPEDETRKKELWIKLYNWALAQDFENLELSPYLIYSMLQVQFPQGKDYKKEKKLLAKLYDFALDQDFSQPLELEPYLINTILTTQLPQEKTEAKKKELLFKLYGWASAQDLQNLELDPSLINTILTTQLPQEKTEAKKKELLFKLYGWASAQDLQNLELDSNLINTILTTQLPQEKTELKKKILLLKLYDFALTQDLQNLELDSNLINTILTTQLPQEKTEIKKRELLLKLYDWASAQDIQNLQLPYYLIINILFTPYPQEKELEKKKELLFKLYHCPITSNSFMGIDDQYMHMLLSDVLTTELEEMPKEKELFINNIYKNWDISAETLQSISPEFKTMIINRLLYISLGKKLDRKTFIEKLYKLILEPGMLTNLMQDQKESFKNMIQFRLSHPKMFPVEKEKTEFLEKLLEKLR